MQLPGYRYYNPELGRWISRDPIEEQGGASLYAFVWNEPVSVFDILGMFGAWHPGPGQGIPGDPYDDWPPDSPPSGWSQKLRDCIAASRFTIKTEDTAKSTRSKPGQVLVVINAHLDPEKCDCICEYPNFKQEAREYSGWRDLPGEPGTPGEWEKDHFWDGTFYDDSRKPHRFWHMMVDVPGLEWRLPVPQYPPITPRTKFFKIDVFTRVVCTGGSARGTTIKSTNWGMQVAFYREGRKKYRGKDWWPKTNGAMEF